jgi:hypothetical protein
LRGQVAQRRLGLHGHVALEIVDLEQRLRRIAHAPDDGGGDFHRVAPLVVDLLDRHIQVARPHRQLALAVQREGPAQAFAAVRADVAPEQRQHGRFVRLQHVQAGAHEHADRDQHAAGHAGHGGQGIRCGAAGEPDADGDRKHADDEGQVAVGGHVRGFPPNVCRHAWSSKVYESDITLGQGQCLVKQLRNPCTTPHTAYSPPSAG